MNNKILDEIKFDKFFKESLENGPTFGQSKVQIEKFVVGTHCTLARQYRQLLLYFSDKYTALKKARIRRKKIEAELNIIRKKIETLQDQDLRTIQECSYEEMELDLNNEEKLIIDAISECNFLYTLIESIPKATAEEFEKQELEYWAKRLSGEAQLQLMDRGSINEGTQKALMDIGINPLEATLKLRLANEESARKLLGKTS
jgi:hypothetical protein